MTPVGTKRRKLSMISAISNQGKEHWLIIKGVFTQDKQISFLRALVHDQWKPIILIRNTSDHYTGEEVLYWVGENEKKIEIYPPVLENELVKKEKKKKDQEKDREFRRLCRDQT